MSLFMRPLWKNNVLYLSGLVRKFMINKIKNMLLYNIRELIMFQGTFKVTSFLIFTPLFLNLFNIIMQITGYDYLTLENISSFLLNPLVLIMLILLVLFMMVYTFFDLSTIIIILDASYQKKKIELREVLGLSLRKSIEVFKIKNIPLAFMILFLIPFLNIGVVSGFVSSIKIPEFIMDYINGNVLFMSVFWGGFILLSILLLRWLYAIHYYVLENCDFKEARLRSINLGKKRYLFDLGRLVLFQGIGYLIYIVFVLIGLALIYLIYKLLSKILIISSVFITIIGLFLALSLIGFASLSMPLCYAVLSIMYYQKKEKKGETIRHIKFNKKKRIVIPTKRWQHFKVSLGLIAILTGSVFTYGIVTNKYNFNIEYIKNTEITAHRGDTSLYPENTIEAFKSAVEKQTDWIELDIQETKDKKIVVSHDANLKRVAGIDRNIYDMTYDEVESVKLSEIGNIRIPSLEEVLKWMILTNVKLNIELKPYTDDGSLVKNTIDLIEKYHLEDRVVLSSGKYSILENIKEINKEIQTAYIMSIAYGDLLKLDKADNFSLEASMINASLIKKAHNNGKEIYAWTVDSKDNINKMLELNVDNIITDDVELTYKLLFASKSSNLVAVYLKWIERIFR